jgi:K+-transporting ATPase A subunit
VAQAVLPSLPSITAHVPLVGRSLDEIQDFFQGRGDGGVGSGLSLVKFMALLTVFYVGVMVACGSL